MVNLKKSKIFKIDNMIIINKRNRDIRSNFLILFTKIGIYKIHYKSFFRFKTDEDEHNQSLGEKKI